MLSELVPRTGFWEGLYGERARAILTQALPESRVPRPASPRSRGLSEEPATVVQATQKRYLALSCASPPSWLNCFSVMPGHREKSSFSSPVKWPICSLWRIPFLYVEHIRTSNPAPPCGFAPDTSRRPFWPWGWGWSPVRGRWLHCPGRAIPRRRNPPCIPEG